MIRQPAFWVLAVGIAVCTPLLWRDIAGGAPDAAVLLLGLGIAALEAALFWLCAAALARRTRPLLSVGALGFGWGLTVVPVVAAFANTQWFRTLSGLGLHAFAPALAAPFDEDALRLVGVLGALLLVRRVLRVHDGLVLGFLVGAGFEVSENLTYLLRADDTAQALHVALARHGVGFGLHALWTAIAGAALASFLARRGGSPRRLPVPVAGILGPLLLHAVWDAPALTADPRGASAVLIGVYAVTLIAFALVVRASRARTRPSSPRSPGSRAGR